MPEVNHPQQWTVHKRDEEVSAGRVEWVEWVMYDRKIASRVKGKVRKTLIRPAMMYDLEMTALTKRQEAELAELKFLKWEWPED